MKQTQKAGVNGRLRPARWKRRNAMSGLVRDLVTPQYSLACEGERFTRPYALKSQQCSGGLPPIAHFRVGGLRKQEASAGPVRTGANVARSGGEFRGQRPEEEWKSKRGTGRGIHSAVNRREAENRGAAERQAGTV